MISSSSSIRKTALSASSTSESVIRSNGLGRSGSSNTSSCDINCSTFLTRFTFFETVNQTVFRTIRFKPRDLNEKGAGVYKIIREKSGGVYSREAFS